MRLEKIPKPLVTLTGPMSDAAMNDPMMPPLPRTSICPIS
jgi:hypothetical protein